MSEQQQDPLAKHGWLIADASKWIKRGCVNDYAEAVLDLANIKNNMPHVIWKYVGLGKMVGE